MTGALDAAAERAVLTALLQDPRTFEKVVSRIPDEGVFTVPINREAYSAILRAFAGAGVTDTPYDLYQIAADIERRSDEVSPSGQSPLDYLTELFSAVPVGNLKGAIEAVTEASVRSRSAEVIRQIAQRAEDPDSDIRGTISSAISELGAITGALADDIPAVQGLASIADETLQRILEGDNQSYLPTGYTEMDEILDGGLIPGGIYIIGARPGVGKSAMALDICRHISIREKKNVLFCNLEMRPQDMFIRLLAAEKTIPASQITRAMKTPGGADAALKQRVTAAYTTLLNDISLSGDPLSPPVDGKGNLWVWSPYSATSGGGRRTVADVAALMEQMRAAGQVDVLVVDYLQLLEPASKSDSRQQDVASTVRYLKELALRYNIPVILLSQVNRGSTDRADKRPMLSDLRESGEIEQAADVVILLHNESKARGEDPRESMLSVQVAKNRHGRDSGFSLSTELEFCRFGSLDMSNVGGLDYDF